MIKTALMRNGFDPITINNVAKEFGGNDINVKHEVNISKGTIIGIMIIVLLGAGVYGFINLGLFNQNNDSLLDVSVKTFSYSHISGDMINYQIYITNMGSNKRFDAIIKTLIVDDNGNIITRKEETIAVETTSSINRNIQLPQNTASGKYYLKIIADYDGKQATSSEEIEVVKNVIEKKPISYKPPVTSSGSNTNAGNSGNINTGTSTNTETSSTTENTVERKTFANILTSVKSDSNSNPTLALNTCSELKSVTQKDVCYETIAGTTSSTNYCSYLEDVSRKDNCYLSFIMGGQNVDVCDKITDTNSKAFCDQLRLVQLMDQYYRENNTEKVIELSKEFNPNIYNDNPTLAKPRYNYDEEPAVSITDIFNEGSVIEEIPAEEIVNNTSNETAI